MIEEEAEPRSQGRRPFDFGVIKRLAQARRQHGCVLDYEQLPDLDRGLTCGLMGAPDDAVQEDFIRATRFLRAKRARASRSG